MSDKITGTLADPETRRCPYDFYRSLREEAPVYIMPGTDFYTIARYDMVIQILQDREHYSNEFPPGQSSFVNYLPEADQLLKEEGYGRRVPTIVFSDPPVHTAFRKLLAEPFRPSKIRAMAPLVRTVLRNLIADIADDGVYDVVSTLLTPLPMYVLADWMGVERDDYKRFKKWSLAANYTLQPPQPRETLLGYAHTIAEMQHYFVDLMARRRAEPKDDLITELMNGELGGERPLTDKEVLSLLETLLVAGNETTTNAMGNGLLLILKDEELQGRLRAQPERIFNFCEELLRIESSVTGIFRRAKTDVEWGGVKIPAGSKIFLSVASANRDESQFPHGDIVDLDRPNVRGHIAFGSGYKTCSGNMLARLELQIFFEEILREFEHLELAIPADEVKYQDLMGLRGVAELPVRLTRRKADG